MAYVRCNILCLYQLLQLLFGMEWLFGAEDLHQLQESWYHLSSGEQSSLLRHFLADGVVNQAIVFECRSCKEDSGKTREDDHDSWCRIG